MFILTEHSLNRNYPWKRCKVSVARTIPFVQISYLRLEVNILRLILLFFFCFILHLVFAFFFLFFEYNFECNFSFFLAVIVLISFSSECHLGIFKTFFCMEILKAFVFIYFQFKMFEITVWYLIYLSESLLFFCIYILLLLVKKH